MSGALYLTFDDGPDAAWTPRVLDVLAAAQVRATFFVIGACAQRRPNLVRRAHAEGHEIGNHTFAHRHPWTMSVEAARRQVRDGAAAIEDVLGVAPRFYRAPHGRDRRCMTEEAQACGETSVGWDISAIDWGWLGRADGIACRLQRATAGNVVLMHDGANRHNHPEELLRVLPGFLEHLRRRDLHPAILGG